MLLLLFHPLTEYFGAHMSSRSKMFYELMLIFLSFWNRIVQIAARRAMHGMFFFGSFYRVKVTGQQATAKEAPILVVAPHSSLFDSISLVLFGPPSVVAKAETESLPFLGSEFLMQSFNLTLIWLIFISWFSVHRIGQFHAASFCSERGSEFTTKNH